MSRTLTFEISDDLFAVFEDMAKRTGITAETYALRWLERTSSARPMHLTIEDRRAGLARLLRHAGSIETGDPSSGDNEKIDSDLDKHYLSDLLPEA